MCAFRWPRTIAIDNSANDDDDDDDADNTVVYGGICVSGFWVVRGRNEAICDTRESLVCVSKCNARTLLCI